MICGDNRDVLKTFEENSFDSIVTDPPYEYNFMGKKWDSSGIAYNVEMWKDCLRLLKPGGYLLAFGGTRTYHRMACAIEDAGFEIRDQIQWIYSSGFPKSLNIGKEVPEFEGFGTSLKPANEPIVVARKPLEQNTVVGNVLKYGTGGINIDGCRVGRGKDDRTDYGIDGDEKPPSENANCYGERERIEYTPHCGGRFPANVILECICDEVIETGKAKEPYQYLHNNYHAEGFIKNIKPNAPSNYNDKEQKIIHTDPDCPCYILDQQTKNLQPSKGNYNRKNGSDQFFGSMGSETIDAPNKIVDSGGASRFFYIAKASRSEREFGLKNMEAKLFGQSGGALTKIKNGEAEYLQENHIGLNRIKSVKNNHPTVKPVQLMRYLVKMVTPPHGVVLDPFAGSGTTGIACIHEEFHFIGIEKEEDYCRIAEARMKACEPQLTFNLEL
jgi:site-specific DNA-methyltransferase (adenine-specific)